MKETLAYSCPIAATSRKNVLIEEGELEQLDM